MRRALVIAVLALFALPAVAHAQLQACCAKPVALPELRATGLEVTQGIQGRLSTGRYAGVKLVAHRTTVVRLYAHAAAEAKLVGAALYGTRHGRPLPGSPLSAGPRTLTPGPDAPTAAERGDAGSGYTFALPDSWTSGTVSLRAQLVPAGAILGRCADCALRLRGVRFTSTGTERVEAVRLTARGAPAVPRPGAALDAAKRLLPLADGAFQGDDAYVATLDVTPSAGPLAVLSQLADATLAQQTCKDIGTPSPCPDQVIAVSSVPGLGDAARGGLNESALPTAITGAAGAVRALGFGLGRSGGDCAPLGGIGFDIRSGAPVSSGSDFMCAGASWISAGGWDDAVGALRTHARARPKAVRPVAGLRVLAFSASGGPVTIWGVRPAVAVAPPDDKAGYSAVVRSRTGRVLGTGRLRAERTSAGLLLDGIVGLRGGSATRVPSAVADVAVMHGSDRVAQRTRSAHAPKVRLTTARATRVAWRARDADGDALTASVDYSTDGGRSFRTVWSGPDSGRASFPRGALGRADRGELRVRVSDGFDQASAVSKPFRAPGHAPRVQLDAPGKTLSADAPLRLAGSAYDDDFAPLSALRWTVDGHDAAAGPRGTVDGLAPGRHTVRLVATDGAGRHGTARVRVTVAPVTPAPLSIAAPAKLDRTASAVTLTVSAVTPCRLTVSGPGVTTTRAPVTRARARVSVPVKPGASALRLTLTFRAGRYGTRDVVGITR